MSQPIFCDESVYLRYAQIIHRAPLKEAFVSLIDPKPPLHEWLLALVFGLTKDPLVACRFLSVLAGLATILAVIPLCRELRALSRNADEDAGENVHRGRGPDALAASACLLFLTCPFLAFYQRMALAESLLVLEGMLVAWLGLRLARKAGEGAPMARVLRAGVPLGLALGAALLTKQNYSYMLMALPVAAVACASGLQNRGRRKTVAGGLALAFGLALLLFLPVLLIQPGARLRDRLFFRASHGSFGGGLALHVRLTWTNLRYVFVPMVVRSTASPVLYEGFRAPADAGWLWIYLTPPVFVLAIAGLAVLAGTRQARRLGFLAVWTLLMLAPFVPFATTAVARYALPAVAPLLLCAASLLEWLWTRQSRRWRFALQAAILLALLVWPLRSIVLQDTRFERQPFARSDRWQYVSGWPAGSASRRAVEWIERSAAHAPLVVVTSHLTGTPDDVVWTYLEGRRNVRLYFVSWSLQSRILRPASPDTFFLQSGFHEAVAATRLVTLAQGVPIFFVGMDPWPSAQSGIPASRIEALNPGITRVARFENPPMASLPHPDAVVIDQLR